MLKGCSTSGLLVAAVLLNLEAIFFYVWVNVARLCTEAYDDVHAADDVASAVSNVDAREGGDLGWGDRIERRWSCPEV